MKTRKTRMGAETFNLLVAAGVLAVVAAVTLLFMRLTTLSSCERKKVADTTADIPQGEIAYRLTDVRHGPFVLPSEGNPWRQEEVAAVEMLTLSAQSLYDKAEPYITVKPSLRARPEPLFAIASMATDMPHASGVKLSVREGYLTWTAAGERAGISPYHTGYRLKIALMVEGVGEMTLIAALDHPTAASPAAWLLANFASYGFITVGEGEVHHVGAPHAAIMRESGEGMAAYLARVRTTKWDQPLIFESDGGVRHIYYVKAEYGIAIIHVSAHASLTFSGDGRDGFIVALYYAHE